MQEGENMNNTIYWFSGTGNSLYAARLLAEALGDTELVSMAVSAPSGPVGGAGCRIGFVFPSYYGDLPRFVRAFAEGLDILPETDLFVLVTMGAIGRGSVKAMEELLAAKGRSLRYGAGVRMPANYILKYDPALFGAKSERRVQSKLTRAERQIRRIYEDIAGGKRQIKKNSIMAKTLYTNIPALDAGFTVTKKCTGCGLCERVCPVGNIELREGRPTWLRHCEHCVACISWCPASAIENGQETENRTRYRNPYIKASELEI